MTLIFNYYFSKSEFYRQAKLSKLPMVFWLYENA